MSVKQKSPEADQEQELETEEQPSIEVEPQNVVLNDGQLNETADEVSEDAVISDFTAPRGVNHGHGPGKHDVRDSGINVRDEFVSEHFSDYGIAPNDHAALWLLSYKKDEFVEADDEVFEDTHDADESRWSRVESRKEDAPIAPETHRALQS